MTDFRVGDEGRIHRIRAINDDDSAFDLSTFTDLTVIYTKPSDDVLTVTPTLGTSDTTIDGQSAPANTWVQYTFTAGQLDESGCWDVQLTYFDTVASKVFQNLTPMTLGVAP